MNSKNNPARRALLLFLSLLTINLLTACSGQVARSTPTYFIPPTLVNTPIPTLDESPTPALPSPTPDCDNNLTWLEDVTVPDGTAFAPGAPVDKIWLVENSGTCNWETGYQLRLTGGDALGADAQQALFPARSGTEAQIQVIFTAPQEPGSYQTSWQAFSPLGEAFGDPIFMLIEVDPGLAEPTANPEGESTE